MTFRDMTYRMFGQDVTAGKALESVGTKADKTGRKFEALGGQADRTRGRFGKMAVGIGASMAALKGIDFLRGGIRNASELAEAGSKVGVIFGKAAPDVMKFAKGADAIGLSDRAAAAALGSFGALFQTLGFGQKDMAGMSKKLVGLSSDLASFNDANPEDALAALRSGINGESEPLRKFGVFLNEARVQAEALALGIVKPAKEATKVTSALSSVEVAQQKLAKATKEHGESSVKTRAARAALARAEDTLKKATEGTVPPLTDAQKAQARYSIILKDTATAQGDFARTADGQANAARTNAAQWDDIKTKIGSGFLPVVTKATKFIGDEVIPKLDKMAGFVSRNADVIVPLVAVLGTIVVGVKAWTTAQAALNVVLNLNPIGAVIIGVAALAVGFMVLWKRSETFRSVVSTVLTILAKQFRIFAGVALGVLGAVLSAAAHAFGWLPGIGEKLQAADEAFGDFKDDVLGKLDELAVAAGALGKKAGTNLKNSFLTAVGPNGLTTTIMVTPNGRVFEQGSATLAKRGGVKGSAVTATAPRSTSAPPPSGGRFTEESVARAPGAERARDDQRLANLIADAIASRAAGAIGRATAHGTNYGGGYAAVNAGRVG